MSNVAAKSIQNITFNQTNTCFAVAMETGYRVYNLEPLAELTQGSFEDFGSVRIVEMLHRSNFIALVGGGYQSKFSAKMVRIWDDKQKTFVLEFSFDSLIRAVKMRRDRLIVVLTNKIYVFSFPHDPKHLQTIETRSNMRGLCELCPSLNNSLMIFPGTRAGSLQLFDVSTAGAAVGATSTPPTINAHRTDLQCIAINHSGGLAATASGKGTLIRVFDLKTRLLVIELRRGTDTATVQSITFNEDSSYLCASSDKGTVHIFAIKNPELNKRLTVANVGYLGRYAGSQWGMTSFTLRSECPCICVFAPPGSTPGTAVRNAVIALCFDGTYHKYVFTADGNCNRESYNVFLDVTQDLEI
ncbi:hypothetical protein ACHWQZ_G017415 [Mnemiopsis leidyi]